MTKTKDTIVGLKKLFKNNKPEYSNEEEYQKEQQFLSHTIQIAQAQEQAEGMLPEKKRCVYGPKKTCLNIKVPLCHSCEYNQTISIATPILAKKILECEEKDKRIEELEERLAKTIPILERLKKLNGG